MTAKVDELARQPVATIFDGQRSAGKQELSWAPDAIPDGSYRLALTAVAGTKQVQSSTRFWVDRTLAATKAARRRSRRGEAGSPAASPSRCSTRLRSRVRVLHGTQVVATLLDSELGAGSQQLSWDGSELPDGRYVVEVLRRTRC